MDNDSEHTQSSDSVESGEYVSNWRRIDTDLIAFDTGEIYNTWKKQYVRYIYNRYACGSLRIRGGHVPVDRLIYEAFYGKKFRCKILHLDGNPKNNALDNLVRIEDRIKYMVTKGERTTFHNNLTEIVNEYGLNQWICGQIRKYRGYESDNGIIVTILRW